MTSDGTESLTYDRQGSTVVLTMNRPEAERADARHDGALRRRVGPADRSRSRGALRHPHRCRRRVLRRRRPGQRDGWAATRRHAPSTSGGAPATPSLMLQGLLVTRWVRKPIIAAVNGDCLGGGCEMLQSTDIRIAEEHARFGVPEARRGSDRRRRLDDAPQAPDPLRRRDGDAADRSHPRRRGGAAMGPGHPRRADGRGAGQGPRDRRGHRRQRPAGGGVGQGVGGRDRLAARGPGEPDRARLRRDGDVQQGRQGGHAGLRREAPARTSPASDPDRRATSRRYRRGRKSPNALV